MKYETDKVTKTADPEQVAGAGSIEISDDAEVGDRDRVNVVVTVFGLTIFGRSRRCRKCGGYLT